MAGLSSAVLQAGDQSAQSSGIVWGRVVDRETSAPVAEAVVALARGDQIGVPAVDRVRTDQNGYFVFQKVAAGTWNLIAGRAGYQSSNLEPIVFELMAGQRTAPITIRLRKYGVIAGTVFDEFDDPVPGVNVRLFSRASHGRWLPRGLTAKTGDRGDFEFSSLLPGEYVVFVPSTLVSRPRTQKDPAGGAPVLVVGESLIDLSTGTLPPRLSNDGRCLVYPAAFSPGGQSPDAATRVVLGLGEVRPGLDIHLAPVEGRHIVGVVTAPDAAGTPSAAMRLVRTDASGFQPPLDVARTSSLAGGRFEFPCVPPGSYAINAVVIAPAGNRPAPALEIQTGSEAMTVGAGTGSTSSGVTASESITVGARDLLDISMRLIPGVRINGRIVVDPALPGPIPEFRRQAILLPAADGSDVGNRFTDVEKSLTFTTPAIPSGRYLLSMSTPSGWQVRSAMLDGRDISDEPFDPGAASVGEVIVTLSNRLTRLSGVVRDSSGQPAPVSSVLVFSADPRHWRYLLARRTKVVRTAPSGTYAFAGSSFTGSAALPPGEYFVIAPAQDPPDTWQDPAQLAELARHAIRVNLAEGQSVIQDLRAVDLPAWHRSRVPSPPPVTPDLTSQPASGPFVPETDEVAAVDISGQVIAADPEKKPVRRAVVSLAPSEGGEARHTVTDDDGRFVFDGVSIGYYRLTATKAGFLVSEYGAKSPGRPGVSLAAVADRQVPVTLEMARGASISGTVRNSAGLPLVGAVVRAIPVRNTPLGPSFLSGGSRVPADAIADHEGRYRVTGLLPGDYVVGATVGSSGAASPARRMTSEDLDIARNSTAAPERLPQDPPRALMLMRSTSTFYSNARELSGAAVMTMRLSEGREGVDFSLPESRTFTLSGTVLGVDGKPASGARFMIWPKNPYLAVDGLADNVPGHAASYGGAVRINVPATGQFSVRGLTQGSYTVMVIASGATEIAWARETIEVGGDMTVALKLAPALRVSGRVTGAVDAPQIAGTDLAKASVVLQSAETDGSAGVSPPRASVQADGTFAISGVVPGAYWLSVTNLPGTWSAVAAEQGGMDVLNRSWQVSAENDAPLSISLSDHPSELAGSLSDVSGQPATDYFVVVFSQNDTFWFDRSRRVAATRPRSDGSFDLRNLPDGEYRIAAVTDVRPSEWFEPAFLQGLVSFSVPVTIKAGTKTIQKLRIGR